MKIEVGKTYRSRGGWRAKVVADDLKGAFPFLAVHYCEKMQETITACHNQNGAYQYTDTNIYELVAEWVDPPKPLECWMLWNPDGYFLNAAWSKREDAERCLHEDLQDKTYVPKHMREVTDE